VNWATFLKGAVSDSDIPAVVAILNNNRITTLDTLAHHDVNDLFLIGLTKRNAINVIQRVLPAAKLQRQRRQAAATAATTAAGAAGGLGGLGAGLSSLVNSLAPVVGSLAPVVSSLAPVVDSLAPTVSSLGAALTPVVADLAPVVSSLAPVVDQLAPALTPVANSLAPVVASLTPALAQLTPALAPIIQSLTPVLAPLVQALAPALAPLAPVLAPILQPIFDAANATAAPQAIVLKITLTLGNTTLPLTDAIPPAVAKPAEPTVVLSAASDAQPTGSRKRFVRDVRGLRRVTKREVVADWTNWLTGIVDAGAVSTIAQTLTDHNVDTAILPQLGASGLQSIGITAEDAAKILAKADLASWLRGVVNAEDIPAAIIVCLNHRVNVAALSRLSIPEMAGMGLALGDTTRIYTKAHPDAAAAAATATAPTTDAAQPLVLSITMGDPTAPATPAATAPQTIGAVPLPAVPGTQPGSAQSTVATATPNQAVPAARTRRANGPVRKITKPTAASKPVARVAPRIVRGRQNARVPY